RCVVIGPQRLEKARDGDKIVARGDQANLFALAVAHLLVADVGQQPIADALTAHRIFQLAALGKEKSDGLGRATIADSAIPGAVWLAQEAQIADARPLGKDISFRTGTLQL